MEPVEEMYSSKLSTSSFKDGSDTSVSLSEKMSLDFFVFTDQLNLIIADQVKI